MGTTNLDSLTLSGTLTAAGIVGPTTGAIAATTISASDVVSVAAGTAGAPEITFTGDTDTGIYHPAANSVAISCGGSAKLTADTSGFNGVLGATTPAAATVTTLTVSTSMNGPIGVNTPAAGTFTTATATAFFDESAANALTAAGSTRTDALAVTKARNRLTTAATGTGVVLPASATVGVGGHVIVYNDGAQPIKVYAAGSDTIDGTAGSTGVTLSNTKRCEYFVIASGAFISAQLGAVSA